VFSDAAAPQGEIPVILNPAARSTRAAARIDRIRSLSPRLRLCETMAAGDARRWARELAEAGAPVVVAAGGDGTMNEVVNGLAEARVESRPALGLLPTGTMNVLARELSLPHDLGACWRIIETGRTREIDLWRANDRSFAQLAGIGIDAAVIDRTSWESKRRLGPLSYLGSLVRELAAPAPLITVVPDHGGPVEGGAVLVGNGRFYGGPLRAFPAAVNTDGWLDVLILHHLDAAELAALFVDVIDRAPHESPGCTRLRARRLHVEASAPLRFEVDGELGGHVPLDIEPAPFKLRVLA
jgi:YegS/Rv2252/BmrU family lipid kinase